MNNNEELIAQVKEQICKDKEINRKNLERLEIKREIHVRQLVQKVVAAYGLPSSGPDFEALFQECLAWEKAQAPCIATIVVNEMNS